MSDVSQTLAERGERYGRFMDNGTIAQAIKEIFKASPQWPLLKPDAKEVLDLIATKLSRILTMSPDYDDHWRDIAGYAQLIVDRINGTGTYATLEPDSEISNLVTVSQCGEPGTVLDPATAHCQFCRSPLGNVHFSICSYCKDPSNPG